MLAQLIGRGVDQVVAEGRTPAQDAYLVHEQYWADSGGDVRVPVNPFAIARDMGVIVYLAVMGADESGYIALDSNGRPAIYLNDTHHERRQRFTCAHELGHFVDQTLRGVPLRTSWRDERAAHGTDTEEIYANRFAAALLMPRPEVERLHRLNMAKSELARRFEVSEQAMGWRLKNLGLA